MKEIFFNYIHEVACFLSDTISLRIQEQLNKYDEVVLVLPGGNSIKYLYSSISKMDINWNRVWITISDERLVEPNSEISNEKQTKDLFISKLPCNKFLRINYNLIDKFSKYPVITILSMGKDGHVASLFPNEINHWGNYENCQNFFYKTSLQKVNRISLSVEAILLSKYLFVLVLDSKRKNGLRVIKKIKEYNFLFQKSKFLIC